MNKLSHRQGILLKDINNLKKDELIQIVSEEKDTYLIRKCYTAPKEKVNKNYIKTV
jgi:hypothetical protein